MKKTEEQIKLGQLLSDIVYIPSDAQKRVKAKFWSRRASLKLTDSHMPSYEEISRLANDRRLQSWWSEPGFKEWFRNDEEFRERTEYIAQLALDVLEQTMLDPTVMPNNRIVAAKIALTLADRFPKVTSDEGRSNNSNNISEMSQEELEQFIAKKSKLITLPSSDIVEKDTKPEGEGNE